jgi:hypothetical protein
MAFKKPLLLSISSFAFRLSQNDWYYLTVTSDNHGLKVFPGLIHTSSVFFVYEKSIEMQRVGTDNKKLVKTGKCN